MRYVSKQEQRTLAWAQKGPGEKGRNHGLSFMLGQTTLLNSYGNTSGMTKGSLAKNRGKRNSSSL